MRPFTYHVIHKFCLHYTEDFSISSIIVWKLTKWERGYQFMHGKDFWPTKLIYFPHTASIIFQGCNNCSSNINNIYRLDSANKTLLGIYTQNDQFFFSCKGQTLLTYLVDPSPMSGRKEYFFAKWAHRFKIRSSVPIITAGFMTVACNKSTYGKTWLSKKQHA